MSIAKRFSVSVIALAMTAAMVLGSLSFVPKSFAVDNFVFPFSESEIPSLSYTYTVAWAEYSSQYDTYYFHYHGSNSPFTLRVLASRIEARDSSGSYVQLNGFIFRSDTATWSTAVFSGETLWDKGVPLPYSPLTNCTLDIRSDSYQTFNYELSKPSYSKPIYQDYSPFYFPELPHGEFDGNINVVDGQFSVDLGSVTGTTSNSGDTTTLEHYSFVVPYYNVTANSSSSDFDFNDTTGIGHVQNSDYSSGNYTVTGQTTNTVHYVESGTIDINGSAPVSYTPSFNETTRFLSWSLVSDASYIWFISDTRNKITGKVKSVSGDTVTLQYVMSANNNVVYPSWCIVFDPMGNCIQVVSPLVANLSNTYEVDCTIGTLEQDQDTGVWSCDPLYHGFWLSQDSPSLQDISKIQVAENKKYLANPVFGEEAFTLNFLNSINDNLLGLRSDISSLQSAMQSSISGQTSAFENMDAPSAEQPSTSNMMDYFAQESAFNAPDTSSMFSGDIKTGHAWQGVTWWSSKFNDIIVANDTIVGFTTAMLTLGLAVMIIGRRFSMR